MRWTDAPSLSSPLPYCDFALSVSLTPLDLDGVLRWCLIGLWYAGADLHVHGQSQISITCQIDILTNASLAEAGARARRTH